MYISIVKHFIILLFILNSCKCFIIIIVIKSFCSLENKNKTHEYANYNKNDRKFHEYNNFTFVYNIILYRFILLHKLYFLVVSSAILVQIVKIIWSQYF